MTISTDPINTESIVEKTTEREHEINYLKKLND